jgi:hypothetical protein
VAIHEDDADPNGRTRFPFITLKAAIDRTRVLHKNGAGHAVPVGEAAKLWGYSEKASGWRSTVAALRYYGLIETSGTKEGRLLRLTPDARRYFLDERPEEHKKLHIKFATSPQAFADIWTLWSADPPSDSVARSILKTQFRYQENSAAQFLGIYKANLAFANLRASDEDSTRDDIEAPLGGEMPQDEATALVPPQRAGPAFAANSPAFVPVQSADARPPHNQERARLMENERELTTGLLSKDANFRLIVSGKIGAKEIERLIRKLEVDKEILAEADTEEFEERETTQDGAPI